MKKKPLLLEKSSRTIFMGFLFKQIEDDVRILGFSRSGHSSMIRILENPVYAGLLKVPAYGKNVSKYIKGIHEPIVAEMDFWQSSQLIQGGTKVKCQPREDVPLRGVLKCHCGSMLTAGNSKGKNRYYWYYKCNAHPKINLAAKKLHSQFDLLLENLSLTEDQVENLNKYAMETMESVYSSNSKELMKYSAGLKEISKKILSLEEKYIADEIAYSTYNKWLLKLKTEEMDLQIRIDNLTNNQQTNWDKFQKHLPKLKDVKALYEAADLNQKHTFIRTVFNSNLYYFDGVYRTPYLHPLFKHNVLKIKEKRLLITEQPIANLDVSPVSSGDGS